MITSRIIYKLSVRVLKGFEIELWQSNHPIVTKNVITGWKLDGIDVWHRSYWKINRTANVNISYETT
jgi:hypothetical protein